MPADQEDHSSRTDILKMLDSFIDQMSNIRKTLKAISISALILAPLALALSLYLIRHPAFLGLMDARDEFGIVLVTLLSAVIVISSIWIVTGIRQYRLIDSWSKRYDEYVQRKAEIDREIASNFGVAEEPES
ncbi:MAG: hypothetical protein WAL79_07085 [Nitrososphaeraceae archaeon]